MVTAREKNKENKKKRLALQKKYGQRITIARQGRESFAQKDYVTATTKYKEYLKILADLKEVEDIFKITPAMFDQKREITEMLLISQIYWDLARINESTPKLEATFVKALNQFVKFTVNQPFQVLNAEMLRKYIKKTKGGSPQNQNLNYAYQQIFVQSRKCYVSTLCYGQTHPNTLALREFKDQIIQYNWGIRFVGFYYKHSSKIVGYIEEKRLLKSLIITLTRPIIAGLAKTSRTSIVKLCICYRK